MPDEQQTVDQTDNRAERTVKDVLDLVRRYLVASRHKADEVSEELAKLFEEYGDTAGASVLRKEVFAYYVAWGSRDGIRFDLENPGVTSNDLCHEYRFGSQRELDAFAKALSLHDGYDDCYPGNRIDVLEYLGDILQELD